MNMKLWILGLMTALATANASYADTVAYWRFEDGTTGTDVTHIAGADNTFSADILDVSGNGNHLSTWNTGGCCGYAYRDDVSAPVVAGTGAANNLSVKNTGGGPGMFTKAAVSNPTGVNIDTMTPSTFTVEASWKFENGGHRTVVGRDAQNVATGEGALAALYLQAQPDNSIKFLFTDVAGNVHQAVSAPGLAVGYNFGSDPDGLNADWYHLVGVSDGTDVKLYVNNKLVASSPIVSADPRLAVGTTDGGDWDAGSWSVGRGLFNGGHGDRAYGFIDEVRISNSALTPTEFLNRSPLSIEVDTTSGQITLRNDVSFDVNIDFYEIVSDGGALSVAGWTQSLDDRNLDAIDGPDVGGVAGNSPGEGWDQAGGSNANQLVEQFLREEGSIIPAGAEIILGNAFNTSIFGAGNDGDLEFSFGYNGGSLAGGLVEYLSASLPGDFNGDGAVTGRDFLLWQRNPSVGSLAVWQAAYNGGALTANATAVPEPTTVILLTVAGAVVVSVRGRLLGA